MASPVIIVKEGSLEIEVKFDADPGDLEIDDKDRKRVILLWKENQVEEGDYECEKLLEDEEPDTEAAGRLGATAIRRWRMRKRPAAESAS